MRTKRKPETMKQAKENELWRSEVLSHVLKNIHNHMRRMAEEIVEMDTMVKNLLAANEKIRKGLSCDVKLS